MSAALFRAGAFDGRGRDAAHRACRQTLVRSHGAVGTDDRPAGTPHLIYPIRAAADHAAYRPGRTLRSGRQRRSGRAFALHQQSAYQRSRPLCAQRGDPGRRSYARARRANGRLGRHRLQGDAHVPRILLSLADPPADPDAGGEQRQRGVDACDRGVRLSLARRLASRDRRLQHEILQEQDRYRAQFWAAFDAFVPGTPLFG